MGLQNCNLDVEEILTESVQLPISAFNLPKL